jgi:hypothetical protein
VSATRLHAGALVRCALRGEAARALPHLLVRPPGGAERAVALPAELTVGRGPEAGLVIADGAASRLHARLRLAEDGSAAVEDLGSKNGLRLNGLPLGPGLADPPGPPSAPETGGHGRAPAGRRPGGRAEPQLLAAAALLLGLSALLLSLG